MKRFLKFLKTYLMLLGLLAGTFAAVTLIVMVGAFVAKTLGTGAVILLVIMVILGFTAWEVSSD